MRIALVDGYSTGNGLARALAARGISLVHVASTARPHAYFRRSFCPELYTHDLGYSADVRFVASSLATLDVDYVVAGAESGVPLAAQLARAVKTPAIDPSRAAASIDKRLMYELAEAAGIAVPASAYVSSVPAAVAWAAARARPGGGFVVKPIASAGSDGVTICRSPGEVGRAAGSILARQSLYGQDNAVIAVQERVTGVEYYLNSVSVDGNHRMAETWRYTKRLSDADHPIYDFETPVTPVEKIWPELRAFCCAVLDSLGIANGPAHTEVIVSESGPVLVETAARLGGATASTIVEDLLGVSQTGLYVESLVSPDAFSKFDDHDLRPNGTVFNVSLISQASGTVPSLNWRAAIEGLATCRGLTSGVGIGEELGITTCLLDSPGFVFLADESPAAVRRDYQRLRSWEAQDFYHAA